MTEQDKELKRLVDLILVIKAIEELYQIIYEKGKYGTE